MNSAHVLIKGRCTVCGEDASALTVASWYAPVLAWLGTSPAASPADAVAFAERLASRYGSLEDAGEVDLPREWDRA